MNKKRKLITFDWAMKRLLRSKANFGILEGFLSELAQEFQGFEPLLCPQLQRLPLSEEDGRGLAPLTVILDPDY